MARVVGFGKIWKTTSFFLFLLKITHSPSHLSPLFSALVYWTCNKQGSIDISINPVQNSSISEIDTDISAKIRSSF